MLPCAMPARPRLRLRSFVPGQLRPLGSARIVFPLLRTGAAQAATSRSASLLLALPGTPQLTPLPGILMPAAAPSLSHRSHELSSRRINTCRKRGEGWGVPSLNPCFNFLPDYAARTCTVISPTRSMDARITRSGESGPCGAAFPWRRGETGRPRVGEAHFPG